MDNHRQYSNDTHHKREAGKGIDPIGENIQTIADLHKHAERNVSPPQRAIEEVTDFLGRPRFLFVILVIVTLGIVVNILLAKFGLPSFDPPPFITLDIETMVTSRKLYRPRVTQSFIFMSIAYVGTSGDGGGWVMSSRSTSPAMSCAILVGCR